MSVRFCHPFVDEFERVYGAEEVEGFLAGWGIGLVELREDETRWISVAFLEALSGELERRSGSAEIVAHCGRLGVTRKYIGVMYPLLRMLVPPNADS